MLVAASFIAARNTSWFTISRRERPDSAIAGQRVGKARARIPLNRIGQSDLRDICAASRAVRRRFLATP